MSLNQLIENFISDAHIIDGNLFPFLANKKNFDKTKDVVYYSGPYWNDLEIKEILQCVLKGRWLTSGEKVAKFEKEFSKKFNKKYSVMVNSGSSANLVMIAALKKYYKWKDNDEIIVSTVGFPTTIAPIVQNNLKPIFVDISWDDLNWDLDQISEKISSKTKAVFSSPVLGNPFDYDKLLKICKNHNIHLIADNCDSLGSKWKDKFLTDYAVAASCSFYPAHHICTIEGGMVSSDNKEIIDLARSFAWWGRDCYCVGAQNLLSCGSCGKRFDKWLDGYDEVVDHKYVFSNMGYNLKPNDLQGAIGSIQLTKFDEIDKKRKEIKNKFEKYFEQIDGVRVIKKRNESDTSWFGVPIICSSKEQKQLLVSYLEQNRIQTRNYFAGNILLHPAYQYLDDYHNYPIATEVLDRVFFVGCSPTINDIMIEYVKETLDAFEYKIK